VARSLGQLATRLGQPAVVGEILAGIVLGPTVLGAAAPAALALLYPAQGDAAVAFDAVTKLGVLLFLFAAGIEVDLSTVFRQGRSAAFVSAGGIVVPLSLGVAAALLAPSAFGWDGRGDVTAFALFFGTALSISALPVIARTLLDLNLFRSDLGMLVIAAAVVNDLVGWIVFALILGSLGLATSAFSPAATVGLTLVFAAGMLTVGRGLLHRALPAVQRFAGGASGILAFAVALAFASGAFTEWIGVHALFGAFLAGVALGDSAHLREHTRATIESFVGAVFAPLFFASIGLHLDFARHFDLGLCLAVIAIASAGKIAGAGLAARWSGMSRRESLAVGFGMNSRGAMEIVLGLLALRHGLIGERLFVALVVMAMATSIASGPLMERVLRRVRPRRFADHLAAGAFVPTLAATDATGAIRELAAALCRTAGLDAGPVTSAVLEREETQTTALGDGIAAPHARLAGLAAPVVGLGLSERGVDFDAPDGEEARIVFLILTPIEDDVAQIEILGDIARALATPEARERVANATTLEEALATLRLQPPRTSPDR
jgi:Kef-type K+ transport system membrane component KefB/mannitol/fructose-specific phosphotransferase system IIA component